MTDKATFLTGELLYLRGLTRADLAGAMLHWTDDREVVRYLTRGARPANLEQLEAAYTATQNNPAEVELAIVDRETDRHIGVTGLHAINAISRSAEFRILIGAREFWGRGYGTEATELMVAYGFEILNLHKVWLGVNGENVAAVRSYENTGFVREGELRDEIYRNRRYYNVVRMSVLRDEYERLMPTWKIAGWVKSQFRA